MSLRRTKVQTLTPLEGSKLHSSRFPKPPLADCVAISSMLWTSFRSCSTRSLQTCISPLSTRSIQSTPRRAFLRVSCPLWKENTPPAIPTFREELTKKSGFKSFNDEVKRPSIRNQVLFFVAGSTLAFSLAVSNTNVDTEYWTRQVSSTSDSWSSRSPTNADLARAKYFYLGKELQEGLDAMKNFYGNIPLLLQPYLTQAHVTIAQTYLNNSEGKRMCWKICLFNAAIYAAWKFKRLQIPMNVRFMHHPLSGLSYTLLTSMFSHRSLPHLVLNCLALESFGSAAVYYLTREQAKNPSHQLESTAKWHFLAFYVSAGLFSGLVSHIVSAKFRYPRLISQLVSSGNATTATTGSAVGVATAAAATSAGKKRVSEILPSLGASGAIYAAVTLTALGFPETEVALFIPPTYPIPIQWGVGGLLAVDLIGAFRGWRYLDHWAHLGGAAFGGMYYAYGPKFWDFLRAGSLKAKSLESS